MDHAGTTRSQEPSDDAPYADDVARIRETSKWLIGGLAAIGAVLVAGMQLSSIGSIDDPIRLTVAIAAALVGLLSIAVIIWRTFDILAPGIIGIRELAQQGADQQFKAAVRYLDEHPELFEELRIVEPTGCPCRRCTRK